MGMLLVSTNLTSPGANESSLCLKQNKRHKPSTWSLLELRAAGNGCRVTFEGQDQLIRLEGLINYQNLARQL